MLSLPRILSTLLILIAIAAAALWIAGGKRIDNQTSQEIDATPQQIFPFLTEPEFIKQWFGGLLEIDPIVANDPDARRGSQRTTQRIVQGSDGNQQIYSDKVVQFVPDKFVSVKSRGSGGVTTWIYALEPVDRGRTKVTFRVVQSAAGLARLMSPLKENKILEKMETDIRAFKGLVEKSASYNPIADEFIKDTEVPAAEPELKDIQMSPLANPVPST